MAPTAKGFRQAIHDQIQRTPEIAATCQHAHECGGCSFQQRTYAAQVAAKAAALEQLFAEAGLPAGLGALPQPFVVVPSPEPLAYRTRMDYVATKGRFGLRMRRKFNFIIDLQECHLLAPDGLPLARALWQAALAAGLSDYNMRTHSGFLRYIVVRRSPSDELLFALVTSDEPREAEVAALAQAALAHPAVVGVHWLINDSVRDQSFGEPRAFWGGEYLPMRVGKLELLIGPNTFFQNNIHLLPRLLADVAAAAGPAKRLADLYGGIGLIGLHLAAQAGEVVTVEEFAESSALAQVNIARNGAANVRAACATSEAFLRDAAVGDYDVVVVDPPRTGLGAAVCAELLRLAPERLVYVSCNPLTLAEDLGLLAERYELIDLKGYDMFPQTPHVECLAELRLRG